MMAVRSAPFVPAIVLVTMLLAGSAAADTFFVTSNRMTPGGPSDDNYLAIVSNDGVADGANCTVHVAEEPFPTVRCNSMGVDADTDLISVVCRDQVMVHGANFFFGVLDPKSMKATVPLYNVTFDGDTTFRPTNVAVKDGVTYIYDFAGRGSVYRIPSKPTSDASSPSDASAEAPNQPQPERIASLDFQNSLDFLYGDTMFNKDRNTLFGMAQEIVDVATVHMLTIELDIEKNITTRTELKPPGDYVTFAYDGFWGCALLDDDHVIGFMKNSTRAIADLSTGEVVALCPECPQLKRFASNSPSVLSKDKKHLFYIGEPSMSTSFQPLENPYLYTFSTETGKIESTCVMPDDFAYTNVMLPL